MKRAIQIAHRRWGKDDVLLHSTAVAAHERVGTYWHCLPLYAQARKAIWTAVNAHTGRRRIDEAFPHELRENTNEQEMFIRFKCGSTWQAIGSDRFNTLVGAGIVGFVGSEWALANPSAWAYIRPMLEENDGSAAFITTPRGRNHAHAMLKMAQDNPRWYADVSTVHDTGALTAEQQREALDEYIALYGVDLGTAQFEQEYLCSFEAAIPGSYYAREITAAERSGRVCDLEHDPAMPVHTAWDLGKSDSTSIWLFQEAPNGIRILDCFENHGQELDWYVAELNARAEERGYKWGTDWLPHDARAQILGMKRTRVEQLIAMKRNPRIVPLHSKADGINAARQTLRNCWFDATRCSDGIEALRAYRREWDDDTKSFKAEALHDWTSHYADAFRYLAQGWRIPVVATVPAQKPQQLVYSVGSDGRLTANMTVREIVEAKARRKRLEA